MHCGGIEAGPIIRRRQRAVAPFPGRFAVPLAPATRTTLKRLHSLSGVVPIGAFLIEHFFTNSFALFGPEVFNAKVEFLTSLPYVVVLEVGLIGVPILFHAVLGVVIWWSSESNVFRYGYFRNWMYSLQRASGVFLVAFIAVHVYKTRLSGVESGEMFQHMAGYLADPAWMVFYVLGVLAASFHFGNGLFTFGISWGLLPGTRSQRWAEWVTMGIFVVMSLVGLNALLAFRGEAVRVLNL